NKDSFTVMYHGVLAENRGLFETIKAMVYVNKIVPNINLFILGKGLVLDQMIELVDQLELKTCVYFHEAVSYDEIPDYISKADVGIVPLPDELCWQVSSPLKLLEYLAMAKPVIVSPIEAHISVLNNFPAAIFLNSTSPEDISDGIIKAYNIRNQLCKFGIEGRKFVTENFTWNLQASKLEKFITNL
ncbi:MAG: glycosyltransferase, partial [Candidatus Hodarchaeota archaeon]